MNAREMVEQEWDRVDGWNGWSKAAERVIERLQQRVEELETARKHWLYWHGDKPTMEAMKAGIWREQTVEERERYRERLDRFASAIIAGGYLEPKEVEWTMKWSVAYIAAIDAEAEKR